MDAAAATILSGFAVGTMIGLTGLGGGVLLLPILIHVLGVPALVAVGSGALYSALTKVSAAVIHWRQRTYDPFLIRWLAAGSIPGAILGLSIIRSLQLRAIDTSSGAALDALLTHMIGVLLVTIPPVMWITTYVKSRRADKPAGRGTGRLVPQPLPERRVKPAVAVALSGFAGGLLVGLTSIGSGSVIMMLLLLLTARSPAVLVGTDIVHAVLLTGVTGILHLGSGNVDALLVGLLLVGSVPGVLLGTRLSAVVPAQFLKAVLGTLLVGVGFSMI